MEIAGGSCRNSKETIYNKCDDYIISEFMWQPLFICITILFLTSYNTYNAFLISKFFQDNALKFLGTESQMYVPKLKIGHKSFCKGDFKGFWLCYSTKISFLTTPKSAFFIFFQVYPILSHIYWTTLKWLSIIRYKVNDGFVQFNSL